MVLGAIRYFMKNLYTLLLLTASSLLAAQQPASNSSATPSAQPAESTPHKIDKAAAYYHFTMAHMYEEEMAVYGRSDLMTKAIQEYRLVIEADPTSQYLSSLLAELYARTGSIRDAFYEDHAILQRDA